MKKSFADEAGVLGAEPLGVGVMEDPAYRGCNQGEASPSSPVFLHFLVISGWKLVTFSTLLCYLSCRNILLNRGSKK